jgi:hypothetical protein
MGMLIAIDKLYMNKMPNSCKECPLTYLDTSDDAYFGANEKRCVIDDSCIDGMVSERAYDCPLIEAIPKDQYEARLKADMVAMLTDLQLDIEGQKFDTHIDKDVWNDAIRVCSELIQERINKLEKNEDMC